ncbi:MAG: hypothetical protein JW955_08855, partial [Sedimentisphaerales bacterium]|nr:hypothetical protein [Sedimentisphaerales bacterium]
VKACHTKRFSPKTPYRASPIYLKCALALGCSPGHHLGRWARVQELDGRVPVLFYRGSAWNDHRRPHITRQFLAAGDWLFLGYGNF